MEEETNRIVCFETAGEHILVGEGGMVVALLTVATSAPGVSTLLPPLVAITWNLRQDKEDLEGALHH